MIRQGKQADKNRPILAHININSIRNKFDQLVDGAKGNVDILMISETKIHDSFPTMQFHIEGYCVFRLDRNEYGGDILVYVREDSPSKLIPMKNCSIETFFIELNLRRKKWLLCCTYNLHRDFISNLVSNTGKNLDLFSANYDHIVLLGDFNAEFQNHFLKEFCDLYNLKTLIKESTCFKNPENPICIDLMLTNSYRSFHKSCLIETGLSDFHKMIVTVMKSYFHKKETKTIKYRDYSNFCNEEYSQHILNEMSNRAQDN